LDARTGQPSSPNFGEGVVTEGTGAADFVPVSSTNSAEPELEAAMQKTLALLGLLALALTGGVATLSNLISPP